MCQHFHTPVLKSKLLKTNWPSIDTYKLSSLGDITFTSEIRFTLTFSWPSNDNILLMDDF